MELKYIKEAFQEELPSYFFREDNYQIDNSLLCLMNYRNLEFFTDRNEINILGYTSNAPWGRHAILFEDINTFESFWFHVSDSMIELIKEELDLT
jgi:hypothetical protein